MSTSYDVLYGAFFKMIEKDLDFFTYSNVNSEEAFEIAKNRAKGYLIEAITALKINCSIELALELDDESETIGEVLTPIEINLLASLMREKYFERDFSLLKAFQLQFSPKDLQVFSPANERKTFMDMFESIKKENRVLMGNYSSRDRYTGKLKTIDYSMYQNE